MTLPPITARSTASPLGELGEMYRSPRARAKLVTAVLVLDVAALIVTGVLLWDSLGLANAIIAGEDVSDAKLALLQQRGMELALMSAGVQIACAITFGLWTYRVAKNAVAMGGQLSITPGWAVGYYFIPVVSLWKPYQAMAEVWDASDPDPQSEPYQPRSHALLLGWWLSWLVSSGVDMLISPWDEPATAEAWAAQLSRGYFGLVVEAAAVSVAITMIWKLTRRQEARKAALMPEARVA